MNRDEILSKVQKNNEPDEMQISIITKALGISSIIVPVICLIFVLVRILTGNGYVYDLIAITFIQLFVSEYYNYLQNKTKKQLIKCIIVFVLGFSAFFLALEVIFYNVNYKYTLMSHFIMFFNSIQ